MKPTRLLLNSLTGAAITLATVMPAAAEGVSECADLTDRNEIRQCMRGLWQSNREQVKDTRSTARSAIKNTRSSYRSTVKDMRTENKAERMDAVEKCKAMKADLTVTDGMVALADVEAIFNCMKDAVMQAKENRQEVRSTIRQGRSEVRSTIKDARSNLSELRGTRRNARTAARDNFKIKFFKQQKPAVVEDMEDEEDMDEEDMEDDEEDEDEDMDDEDDTTTEDTSSDA